MYVPTAGLKFVGISPCLAELDLVSEACGCGKRANARRRATCCRG
jgi:hypothetical protein